MKHVCETAVNVSECLSLISELIEGKWPIYGPLTWYYSH